MKLSVIYITFFDIIGNFDVANILKFREKIIVITTEKTYPNILKKLLQAGISVIITDNFKVIRKKIKRNRTYKIVSSEIVSDRSIHRDIE